MLAIEVFVRAYSPYKPYYLYKPYCPIPYTLCPIPYTLYLPLPLPHYATRSLAKLFFCSCSLA